MSAESGPIKSLSLSPTHHSVLMTVGNLCRQPRPGSRASDFGSSPRLSSPVESLWVERPQAAESREGARGWLITSGSPTAPTRPDTGHHRSDAGNRAVVGVGRPTAASLSWSDDPFDAA